jgi:preprotein translocase subunit SecE
MARDRQRAKQRQAERRAKRLAREGDAPAARPDDVPGGDAPRAQERSSPVPGVQPAEIGPIDPDLAVGAPPEEEGRSDFVLHDEPDLDSEPVSEDEALQEIEDWEVADEDGVVPSGAGEAGYEARGRRGRADAEVHRERPRVIQFLVAVWAELQRVQWPNRQALVTLTGVVLGFVLIAGGYLGLLDAIFSELIKAIL